MFKEASFKNNNSDVSMYGNENSKIINSKYCEIISKLISNQITSLYHISRDLISLSQWRKNNISLEDLFPEDNFQNNFNLISKIDNDIKIFFTETFILYIISKHLTYFNTDNVSKIPKSTLNNSLRYKDMEVTCLEYLIFDKFSEFGNDILAQKKNDYINFTITSLLSDLFEINKISNNNSFILKLLLDNKDYNFIILITLMTKEEKINSLRLQIICNYNLGNKDETKKLLRQYFIYAKSINNLENIGTDFDDFAKYLQHENLTDFYLLGFQFLFPLYTQQNDIQNRKNKLNLFIGKLFDSCFINDSESVLSLYAMLKNNFDIFPIIENCIIDKFQYYILLSYEKIMNGDNKKNDFLISKLIIYDYELLLKVCLKLENELKNNINNINYNNELKNILKQKIKSSEGELDNLNKFKVVMFCYSKMKEYQRLTDISYFYSKLIDGMIETDSLSLDNILLLLKEKISALNNAIIGCQRRKNSIKYLDIYEYEKEKVIAENKYLIIEFYLSTNNSKIKEMISEDSIAMIKNGRINMLNMIFKLKLFSMAIKTNLVKYLPLKESELFIFNMIKNLQKENEKKLLSLFISKIIRDKVCDKTEAILFQMITEK
jgi:hypothetical protein